MIDLEQNSFYSGVVLKAVMFEFEVADDSDADFRFELVSTLGHTDPLFTLLTFCVPPAKRTEWPVCRGEG